MAGAALAIRPEQWRDVRVAERLIVALDFPTVDEAQEVVTELGDTVHFYKIGLRLQFAPKLRQLFKRLTMAQKNIFLDFKYIDIPTTIEGVIRAASELQIKFITVIGQSHIVEAAIKGRGDSDLKILAVTLLTGMNQEEMQRAYSTTLTLEQFVTARARDVIDSGCDGVISSPQEVKLIRDTLPGRKFLIVTPGIRPRGTTEDDQKRIATPYEAMQGGADYLVVGRPITQVKNRKETARRIIKQMEDGFYYRPI